MTTSFHRFGDLIFSIVGCKLNTVLEILFFGAHVGISESET